jgi:prepilin-type N-terminal cleavage/methylation domain-containing protein
MKAAPLLTSSKGFTVLEVVVALFILGFISAAILRGLLAADRIHARASVVMDATLIAENDIERIRKRAVFSEAVLDCTWEEMTGKRTYEVVRKNIESDSIISDNGESQLQEIEITIKEASKPDAKPLSFRFLQGYSW